MFKSPLRLSKVDLVFLKEMYLMFRQMMCLNRMHLDRFGLSGCSIEQFMYMASPNSEDIFK